MAAKQPKEKNKIVMSDDLQDKLALRLVEGLFILTTALAVYFLIALFSYDLSDPGWSQTGSSDVIQNAAGKSGAWISDFLFYLIGYTAYILPLALISRVPVRMIPALILPLTAFIHFSIKSQSIRSSSNSSKK